MWAIFALLSALGWAIAHAYAKKAMHKAGIGELFIIWLRYVFALPFLLPFALSMDVPHLSKKFFMLHLAWIPFESLALYLSLKAIRISPFSLVMPLLSFTPLFLIFTAWIGLGEIASIYKIPGILLVVFGSYVLGTGRTRVPFGRLISEKGAILMLITAFLYSITSVAGKALVLETNPVFFSVYYGIVMTIVFSPLALFNRKGDVRAAKKELIIAGLAYAMMILSHMFAVQLGKVAYVIALKRLSGLFSVVFGKLLFDEEEIRERMLGAAIMVLGAIIIALA